MSRSRRKTPITSHTTCRSERQDKKQWHSIFRSRERVALKSATIENLEAHLPLIENQVIDEWSMGKDGRIYRSLKYRMELAEIVSKRKGKTLPEQKALKKRLLYKWMAK